MLQVVRTGQILPLPGSGEFIIGRVSEGQSILPDIDMEPFEGFEAGVSRLHARIHVSDSEVSLVDLGSSNGTRLNNQHLMPNQPQPLKHKDLVRLGRMSLQVLIREA
jgi:pSer/pThr/pTyr-binding forkhead associated (FHA) protein